MAKNLIQPGYKMPITPGTNITSGQVVRQGNMLGVAETDIASGSTGVLQINGVFTVPKVSGAVIAAGETLTWDASAGAFDDNAATAETGDMTGDCAVAFESAGNGVTSFKVRFTGAPGEIAA